MPFTETGFHGLWVFDPVVFEDSRGCFYEAYNQRIFQQAGITDEFIQDNQSRSSYGVIRGLHFQLNPYAQAKLVRVLHGVILDVVVDLRKGSPTYGRHYSIELSGDNRKQIYVPGGFAHGFSVLSEKADVLYKCNTFYNKESEGGVHYADPVIGIDWKIPPGKAIISEKDQQLPPLASARNNFVFES